MTAALLILIVVATLASATLAATAATQLDRAPRIPARSAAIALLAGYLALLLSRPDSVALSNVTVVAAGAAAGVLIAGLVASREALVALAIAASIADIVSFTTGPTRWLLDRDPTDAGAGLLEYLTVTLPWGDRLLPVVGIGDLMFTAAYYLILRTLRVAPGLALAAPLAGLLVALAVGLAFGGAWAIPFMSATTVAAAHWLSLPRLQS